MEKYFYIGIIFILLFSKDLFSFPGGQDGRTRKTTSLGCSSCHYSGNNVSGIFNGPDTLIKGQSYQLSLTITKQNTGLAGLDIAVSKGIIDTTGGGQYIKFINGELVHKAGIALTSNTITINFRYTAPLITGYDTLWATVASGYNGNWKWVPEKIIYIKQSTGIIENNQNIDFHLYQNYPNPFNNNSKLKIKTSKSGNVKIIVYDVMGREIITLLDKRLKPGTYEINFDGSGLNSGVYYYKLTANGFTDVKKMLMIK